VLLDSWGKNSRVGDANRIRKWLETAAPTGRPG
jgi:D-alanyl-D-alanine endopeptidase (penicillin-binding protein 7)